MLAAQARPDGLAMNAPCAHACPINSRLRVLVVDDHPDSASSLAMLLRMWGYDTRTCFTGPDAVKLADEFLPQVVLLDIGLPQMDGYHVARALRTRPELKQSLLVAVTGFAQESDRRRCQEAGFDLHLIKPVETAQLHALLHDLAPVPPR
jgi:CheY-like chemotaxis protein